MVCRPMDCATFPTFPCSLLMAFGDTTRSCAGLIRPTPRAVLLLVPVLPSTWSGFGGTSVSAPTMAAVQALVNQKTNQTWGNPLSYYYQIGQNEYGTAGGSFQGSSCNASGTGGPGSGCVFNDVTQGDIDVACRYNGTTTEHHCYKPSTNGVDSTDNVTGATVINGGTGYTTAPTCAIAGPTNAAAYLAPTGASLFAGGTQATCTATVNASSTTAVWTRSVSSTDGRGEARSFCRTTTDRPPADLTP